MSRKDHCHLFYLSPLFLIQKILLSSLSDFSWKFFIPYLFDLIIHLIIHKLGHQGNINLGHFDKPINKAPISYSNLKISLLIFICVIGLKIILA